MLADDAGASKTIMTGLYAREMLSRGLVRRALTVSPAGLAGNWERETRGLFRLRFRILGDSGGAVSVSMPEGAMTERKWCERALTGAAAAVPWANQDCSTGTS